MFCKTITKTGAPCIRQVKCGKYCASHKSNDSKNDDEECPICYQDMHVRSVLKCGHTFCVSCLVKCEVACPLCRQETNDYLDRVYYATERIHLQMNDIIIGTHSQFFDGLHRMCELTMEHHTLLFPFDFFLDTFEEKLDHISSGGVDTTKLRKQFASYKERTVVVDE